MMNSKQILIVLFFLLLFSSTLKGQNQDVRDANERIDKLEERLVFISDSLKNAYRQIHIEHLDTMHQKSGAASHVNYNGQEQDFGHNPRKPALDDVGWVPVRSIRSEFRVSAFIQTALIYDWEEAFQQEEFSAAISPVPRNPEGAAWFMDAQSSRFFLEQRSLTKKGTVIKSFIGVDFRGNSTSGGVSLRLRQAYAIINNLTIGWINGALSGYWPAYLDGGAPGAYPLARNATIRYSIPIGNSPDSKILTFSLEAPSSSIDNGIPILGFPTFISRFDWNSKNKNVQVFAGLGVRQLKASDSTGSQGSISIKAGVSGTLAGYFAFGKKNQHHLKVQGITGPGASTWDFNTSGNALDGYYNESEDDLTLIDKWGVWTALEIALIPSQDLTTTLIYSLTNVDNHVSQDASTFNRGTTYIAGLYYHSWPANRMIIGLEYFNGERRNFMKNENGDQIGTRDRVALVLRYTWNK